MNHALPVRRDGFEARIEAIARAAEHTARIADGEQPDSLITPSKDLAGSPMRVLAESVGLTAEEVELVWSVVSRAVDPRVAAHVRALHGDRQGMSVAHHATMWSLAPATVRRLLAIADARHPLRELGLLQPVQPVTHVDVDTCWTAPPRLWSFLAGGTELDAAVIAHGGIHQVPRDPLLDPVQAATERQLHSWLAEGSQLTIVVEGPIGSGRRTAVALAARPRPVIAIDLARVAPRQALELLRALRRDVVLSRAVPVLANLDELLAKMALGDELQLEITAAIDRMIGPCVVTCATPVEVISAHRVVVRTTWPVPDVATRRTLWEDAGATGDLELLAERYPIGAGSVQAAVRSARQRAMHRGAETLAFTDIVAGVQDNISERLGELARRIEPQQVWDELVLPPDTTDDVLALLGRVRHAHIVLETWGLRSKLPRGAGVAALFSGPPGTGKTMVAGLLARELQLELYQVDLSRIVSKWVGETEKQLAKLFAAAEAGHALLLFDEADALFAKRSADVKSATDRYANLEVNYLLQRVESFGGVVILTTNLDNSIDPALRRRLASHIVFGLPDTAERVQLWQRMLVSGAPVARDVDVRSLAEEFPAMSGANVRNAVLSAAFIAAAEGHPIRAVDLRRAARIEYRAMGHVLGKGDDR